MMLEEHGAQFSMVYCDHEYTTARETTRSFRDAHRERTSVVRCDDCGKLLAKVTLFPNGKA